MTEKEMITDAMKDLIATAQCVLSDELYLSKLKSYRNKKPQSNDIIVVSPEFPDYGEYLRSKEDPGVIDYSHLIYFNLKNTVDGIVLDQTPKKYVDRIIFAFE